MAFAHSHDFKIDTFNAESHLHTHFHSQPALALDPMEILRNARAVEATHTSRTAAYAPKCKPGSREKVIQDIRDWIGKEEVSTSILWFQGPAGGGKTCIMREVVAQCQVSRLMTASYFFSTRVAGLDDEFPFIATIAHQLCMYSPALEEKMSQAILSYPDMFKESQEFQAERLLLNSLSNQDVLSTPRIVVAVDGLDECRDPDARVHLIRVLRKLATSIQNLVVVVASRPEVDVRTEFGSPGTRAITRFLRLQDYDGTSDVRNYLCDEFCSIRDTHPAKDTIPPDWPSERILGTLVDNSSGSYIYPSTVIKYVRNPRRNPIALLDEVLSLRKAKTNALSELDSLYGLILHPPGVDIPVLRRLLHCIVGLSDDTDRAPGLTSISSASAQVLTPAFLDDFLSLPMGTTSTTFCDLHSLISVPSQDIRSDGPLRFHHKSLEDYLKSPERSGDLYQPVEETRACLTIACTSYLQDWLRRAELALPNVIPNTPALAYSLDSWISHLFQLFLTLSRKNEIKSDPFDSFPESVIAFDPEVLWRISSLAEPQSSHRFRLVLDIGGIQRQLHVLICTLSVGNRPFNMMNRCIPICTRASRLLEIADSADAFDAYLKANAMSARESEEDVEDASHPLARAEIHDSATASAVPPSYQRRHSQSGRSSIPRAVGQRRRPSLNPHEIPTLSSTTRSLTPRDKEPRASTAPTTPKRPESLSTSSLPAKKLERPSLSKLPAPSSQSNSRSSPSIKRRPKSTIPDPVDALPSVGTFRATTSLGLRLPSRTPGKGEPTKPGWRF